MKNSEVNIRLAVPEDAEALLNIYRPYVEETAITFEYAVPTEEEFAARIRGTLTRYPYLIAEKNGHIAGYAYAGKFNQRAAYDWAVETSIYVEKMERGAGIGRELYDCLERLLAKQGILNLNACIAYAQQDTPYLTNGSLVFHEKLGFSLAGHFHRCGYKFRQWYDMVWMEKQIGVHSEEPSAVKSVQDLKQEDFRQCGVSWTDYLLKSRGE